MVVWNIHMLETIRHMKAYHNAPREYLFMHSLLTVVSVSPPGETLSDDDLTFLLNSLKKAAVKWRNVGIHLGIENSELEAIQCNPILMTEGIAGYFREMLSCYLKRAPPDHYLPTLDDLALALRKAGEERLAFELRGAFLKHKGVCMRNVWNRNSAAACFSACAHFNTCSINFT